MIFLQLEINCNKPKSPITQFRLRRTSERIGGSRPKYYEFQIYYNALKLRTLSRRRFSQLLIYIDEKGNPTHRDNRRYQEFHASQLLPDNELIFQLVTEIPELQNTWYWNVYGYYFIQDQLTHFLDKTIIITGHIPCPHELQFKMPQNAELPTTASEK